MAKKDILRELGRAGLHRWGGVVSEEMLTELQGKKGVAAYKEMSENDDMIGASLYAIEMMMRQVSWDVQSASSSVADKKARDFVLTCMDDMEETWTDFISEVLSFLTYGWSYHEIVYKRRMGRSQDPTKKSRYEDGLIGWRKLPIRSQDTLYEWAYEDDRLTGLWQSPPPTYAPLFVPLEKSLHFKTKLRKANPEGKNILRNAYRSWYMKRRIQDLEGIGIERDLAGLPVMQAPEGTAIWDEGNEEMLGMAETIVQNIRADIQTGVVLPDGWNLSLLSSSGKKQFDTNAVIERYDNRIAMTMLTDFVMLGHEQVGSFALSSDKTELFSLALGTFLDVICQVFNQQAIPRLIDLNGGAFQGITDYPMLIHGDLETQNLDELGTFIKDMSGCGAITLDGNLEDYLRESANLPERESGYGEF